MALAKKIKRLARLLLPTRTLELAAEMRPKKEANQRKFSNPCGCPNWRKFSKQLARVFKLVPFNHPNWPPNWREFSNSNWHNWREFSNSCPSIIVFQHFMNQQQPAQIFKLVPLNHSSSVFVL